MSAAIIKTARLTVGYRRRRRRQPILGGLNLSVAPGEMVYVLGPNGVGKSTLLRTLAGLQRPLAGRILVDSNDLSHIRSFDLARLIGVVLSERVSVGALLARQMVALGRYAHIGWDGRLTPHDHEVVDRAIEAVRAEHLAGRDCRELSDGEGQRLNLARVLAQEPAVIILDEPTAFLDLSSRIELTALLRRLAREHGLAVIASTHDLDLALRNADSVWLADPGREVRCGTPEDLILNGAVAKAFSTAHVQFSSESLCLHVAADQAPVATVNGLGLGARLATTALEREGYRIVSEVSAAALIINIADDGSRWQALHRGANVSGTSFAALAAFARRAAMVGEPAAAAVDPPSLQAKG